MESEITMILENIQRQVDEALVDAVKFDNGNNSAGTRVRKAMQNIKGLAQEVRVEVQEQKSAVPA